MFEHLSSADLALQDTGAVAAAEYGRLAVWEDYASGRCINAGYPPRPLTCFRYDFSFCLLRAYPGWSCHVR